MQKDFLQKNDLTWVMLKGAPTVLKKSCIDRFVDSYAEANLQFQDNKWLSPRDIELQQAMEKKRSQKKVKRKRTVIKLDYKLSETPVIEESENSEESSADESAVEKLRLEN